MCIAHTDDVQKHFRVRRSHVRRLPALLIFHVCTRPGRPRQVDLHRPPTFFSLYIYLRPLTVAPSPWHYFDCESILGPRVLAANALLKSFKINTRTICELIIYLDWRGIFNFNMRSLLRFIKCTIIHYIITIYSI